MSSEINPKLSIALTAFNHEQFIAYAIESILSQKVNFNYEIIVGEDNSTDGTKGIICQYAEKHPNIFKILERKSNLGYTKNFDDTLKNCKGEYIAIFDGDDIMLPGKLQKEVDFLDNNRDFVMVGHDVIAFDSDSSKEFRIIRPKVKKDVYTIEDLIEYGSFFANCSKMFRKSELPAAGIDFRIKFIADWYITLCIVKTGKIGYIWEALARYRLHASSIIDRKSTRLNSSHIQKSRMPSSA